jgi:Putative esterase
MLAAPLLQQKANAAPLSANAVQVSDGFGRADGGLGSDWTTVPGTAAPQISGGAVVAGQPGALNSAYWSAGTFSGDQYAQAALPASSGGSYGPGLAVRLSGATGYLLWYGNSPGTVSLWRMDSASSWTELGQSGALAVSPSSDVWRVEASGSTISGYQNGNLVVTATDSRYSSGSPGVWLFYAANKITSWAGGDLTASGGGQPSGGTSVSDGFGRADGGLGSDWTTVPGTAAPQISGGAVVAGQPGALNSAYWSAGTFSGDQYAQAALPASSGGSYGPGLAVRLSGATGYLLWYGNSPGTVSLWRMDSASSWTELGQSGALAVSPSSDVWRVEASGSTISGYQNGNLVVTATDSRYSSGSPGVWLFYAANKITSWAGGDLTASGGTGTTPSFSVGGTVSGLAGPVVLRDNGGDDLTVPADGGFTFATAVATGSAYAVTVATDPPGQACAVADGSGTVASAAVTSVTVTCTTNPAGGGQPSGGGTPVSDNFGRADGALGSNWTDMHDGGLAISSQAVVGTSAGISGDLRTGETYSADQYSQVQLTATQLSGWQWIGPSVRMQADGESGYVGAYSWNNGAPELILLRRDGTALTQLGNVYSSGPLAAGTTLTLEAVGNTLAFLANDVERIAVGDGTYAGGDPGIMADGTARAGNWSGGTAGFTAHYLSTDASGVATYDVISANDGDGPQPLRVLQPTDPAPRVAHNFLFVLPVEPGEDSVFGDGMATLEALNAQNEYNLTIIEPSFAIDPWYADNPIDPREQQETFMTQELVPWVKAHLAATGTEQNWLIGFSKSGIGGQDLIQKHPNLFTLAASWDFPAGMTSYDEYGGNPVTSYGTNANFQANYELSPAFLAAHAAPFTTSNRIWIGGYGAFQADDANYDTLLTAEGIKHTTETPTLMTHRWDSGWVPLALGALYQDSINLNGS